jgi:predicted dehydrogenase
MLKYGEFDVFTVATPSGIHPDLGILAAKAGSTSFPKNRWPST